MGLWDGLSKVAYVDDVNPTINYGIQTYFYVRQTAAGVMNAYLEFDYGSLTSSDVVSSKLYLYRQAGTTSENLLLRRITSSWTETGVTWNTQPSNTTTNEATYAMGTSLGWKEINITQLTKDIMDNTNYGLRLSVYGAGDVSTPWDFRSDDYATVIYRPYIVIATGDKYVVGTTGLDTLDGDCWEYPYYSIKKGIDNVASGKIVHIAFGDYSSQNAIDLNKNLELLCEQNGGGGTGTVTLPVTT